MPTTQDFLFVSGQLSLFIAYVIVPGIRVFPVSPVLKIVGGVMLAGGVVVGLMSSYQLRKSLSPFPAPLKKGTLLTTGIYKYVRHPIYTSILMVLTGHLLTSPQTGRMIVTGLLAVLFFFKSRYEEKLLMANYPDYQDYKKRTGRFFPGI